jgi:hypothetical protein
MMSAPTIPSTAPVLDPRDQLRLRSKPKAPTTGWVDGGWWPRSRDLAAELPGLLSVLAAGRRGSADDIDTLLRSRLTATEGHKPQL